MKEATPLLAVVLDTLARVARGDMRGDLVLHFWEREGSGKDVIRLGLAPVSSDDVIVELFDNLAGP